LLAQWHVGRDELEHVNHLTAQRLSRSQHQGFRIAEPEILWLCPQRAEPSNGGEVLYIL
jgi:hypothetical protein